MRHAILGGGGIGGLLAGALARSGADVLLLLRPETLAQYPGQLRLESAVLGDFAVEVAAAKELDIEVDVLWVATKATQLEAALRAAPAARVGAAMVIPLLNGIDHVRLLRGSYTRVTAGTIRVESEKLLPGLIRQRSPFLRVDLVLPEWSPVVSELRRAGFDCGTREDERTLLWEKLAFLAPLALATTALDAPLGAARSDALFAGCRDEVLGVANAEGARLDEDALNSLHDTAPDGMRSSMQKDVEAGREPELEAIAGPIVAGGRRHRMPTPSTERLVELINNRRGART